MPESGWDGWSALGTVALVLVALTAVVVVVLLVSLVRRHRKVHQPGVPVSAKVAYYGSIVYALLPLDVLPDPILVDDIGVLAAALVYVGRVLGKVRRKRSDAVARNPGPGS